MILQLWDLLVNYLRQTVEDALVKGILPPVLIIVGSAGFIVLVYGLFASYRAVKNSETGEINLVFNRKPFIWITVGILTFAGAIILPLLVHALVAIDADPVKFFSPLLTRPK